MNQEYMQANWKKVRGKAREKWGKLTDDDLDRIAGRHDQLVGTVQQRYGSSRDEAERQVRDFENSEPGEPSERTRKPAH